MTGLSGSIEVRPGKAKPWAASWTIPEGMCGIYQVKNKDWQEKATMHCIVIASYSSISPKSCFALSLELT